MTATFPRGRLTTTPVASGKGTPAPQAGVTVNNAFDQCDLDTGKIKGLFPLYLFPSGDVTGASDTAAIQAAFNTATASLVPANRTIIFASGQYYTNAKIVSNYGITQTINNPLEIIGIGWANITQVTNNVGIFEFQLPAHTFGGFLTIDNLTLQYANAQPATNTNAVGIGFRDVPNPGIADGIFQLYLRRLRLINCFRCIANTQPSGTFTIWGVHITNLYTNSRSGAALWLTCPTPAGNPNIEIDFWLDSQSSASCPDPAVTIAACNNLSMRNMEFLSVTNNQPLIHLTTVDSFVIDASKCEQSTWTSVASGPLSNFPFFFQNSYGMVNGFTFGLHAGSAAQSHKATLFAASGVLQGAVTLSGINIYVQDGTDTIELCSAAGGVDIRWLNPPTITTLGSGPAIIGVYNSGNNSAASASILFDAAPGGEVSADNGDASISYVPISLDPAVTAMPWIQVFNTALTSNRTVTLPTGDNITDGMKIRTVRTANATGASTLTIGSKTLAAGQWCEHQFQRLFNGTTAMWVQTAAGSL